MRKVYQLHVLVLSVLISVSAKLSAASYTWNGSVSEEWSNSSNWSPAGVPDLLDDVIINGSGSFQPLWEELPGIRNLTISGGTLNLTGFFMPVYGTCNFTGGTITSGTLVISSASALFSGTTFDCHVTYSGASAQLNGSVFNGNVSITKVGGSSVVSNGGNTFNGNVELINTDNSQTRFENNSPDVFNGNLRISNQSSGGIYMTHGGIGTLFNGNVEVNSTGNTGVRFGQNGGTSTLATGKNISIGSLGFSMGFLMFKNFTQIGSNHFDLLGSGSSRIYFEDGNTFDAIVEFNFSLFYLNGTTFNDSLIINKTTGGSCTSEGGNVFNGPVVLNKTANALVRFANTNPDIFNEDLYLADVAGNNGIDIAYAASGNQFNGDIYLNISTVGSVSIGWAGGTSILSSGNKIKMFNTGLASGSININNFSQSGAGLIALSQTSGSGQLNLANCTFDADLDITVPGFILSSSVFNGDVSFSKVGTGTRTSAGGNVFNGNLTLGNTQSGDLTMAQTFPDTYEGDVTIYQSGLSYTYMSNLASGNIFNGNIILNSSGSSRGIRFGQSAGTSTFSASSRLQIGVNGFALGELGLRWITVLGSAPFDLNINSGSALAIIADAVINPSMDFNTPRLILARSTFNGAVDISKNGAVYDTWTGGSVFNGPVDIQITNGRIYTASALPEIFNGTLRVYCSGNTAAYLSNTALGSEFNDDLTLIAQNTTSYIYFGQSGGTSTLASGANLTLTDGINNQGIFRFRNFTQIGSEALTLHTGTTNSSLYFESSSVFNGAIDAKAGVLYFDGTQFNSSSIFEATGSGTITSRGGNSFAANTTITSSGSAVLILSNNAPDSYLGQLNVNATGAGARIQLAQTSTGNVFSGPVVLSSINGATGVYFGANNGTSTFNAGAYLSIAGAGFNSGELRLHSITQAGNDAHFLNLTGTATILNFVSTNTFGGNMTSSASRVFLNGSIFNGVNSFEQTGNTAISSTGGNYFNGATQLTLSGTGAWYQSTSAADTYNASLTLKVDNSSGILYMAHNAAGTTVNGNIQLISTNGTGGIRFGQGTSGSLSSTGSLSLGAGGFNAGDIRFRRVTQSGLTANSLVLSGTATTIYFETGNSFASNMTATSGSIYLNGSQFAGATLTQNGSVNIVSNGGNSFSGAATINVTGSGSLLLANSTADIFNSTLTANNSGSSVLYLAHRATGNQFNGNVTLSSTGSSQGIRFGQSNGTSTLASGASFAYGGSGFTSGSLRIRNLVQSGSTAISLISASAGAQVYLETGNTFTANVTVASANLYLNGTTFQGTTSLTNSGTATIGSSGGNIFNGTTTIISSGTGEWRLASTSSDTYNGNVTFRQSVANRLYVAYGTSVNFNGNISTVGSSTALTFAPNNNNGWIVFTGSSAQTISADAARPPVIPNLRMNKSGNGLTLNRLLTISRNLTLDNGVITSNATNLLVINDNVSVSNASSLSYVNGPVRKVGNDAFTFPTGKSGVYLPIAISAPINAAHHFTAELYRASSDGTYPHASRVASIETLSQCEYWILNRTNGNSNVNVTLGWNGSECLVANPSTLVVSRWNGTSWQNHGNGGTTGSAAAGTVVSSAAITSFSPFAVGSTSPENPLPVELTLFTAVANPKGVLTSWETASEMNSHYFEIERSKDLVNFEFVGRVEGSGNANWYNQYELLDEKPLTGVSYYRLIQVDYDGTKTVYDPKSVNKTTTSSQSIKVWPNPTASIVNIGFEQLPNEICTVVVTDALGMQVYSKSINPSETQQIQVDLESLASGVYKVHVFGRTISSTAKFIKN